LAKRGEAFTFEKIFPLTIEELISVQKRADDMSYQGATNYRRPPKSVAKAVNLLPY